MGACHAVGREQDDIISRYRCRGAEDDEMLNLYYILIWNDSSVLTNARIPAQGVECAWHVASRLQTKAGESRLLMSEVETTKHSATPDTD